MKNPNSTNSGIVKWWCNCAQSASSAIAEFQRIALV